MEDSRKSREYGISVLIYRRKRAADAAQSGDPSCATNDASNRVLNVCQAKVSFDLMARTTNAQVVERRQHVRCTQEQCIQQLPGRAVLAHAFALSCGRRDWWLSDVASSQNLARASDPFVARESGNSGQAAQTLLLARVMQTEQDVLHRPTSDVPARRLLHHRARGVFHRCCEHRRRHQRSPVDRACLVRQCAARCRSRPWPPEPATHAKARWVRKRVQLTCSQCNSPSTRMPVSPACWNRLAAICSAMRSTVGARRSAASSLHRSNVPSQYVATHRSQPAPRRCEPWGAIAPAASACRVGPEWTGAVTTAGKLPRRGV